jgi:ABC-type multidrug transport system fused ATPase/permease subunit
MYRCCKVSYAVRLGVPVVYASLTNHRYIGLSLTLSPGKVVALVGPSGGGKTTVANLIELFYYPQRGSILLDGVNIQQLDVKVFHEHIGIVSQGPCLFAASIRDSMYQPTNQSTNQPTNQT